MIKEEDKLVGTLLCLKGASITKNKHVIYNIGNKGAKLFKTAKNSNFKDNNSKPN